jgi:hypothetical protein
MRRRQDFQKTPVQELVPRESVGTKGISQELVPRESQELVPRESGNPSGFPGEAPWLFWPKTFFQHTNGIKNSGLFSKFRPFCGVSLSMIVTE